MTNFEKYKDKLTSVEFAVSNGKLLEGKCTCGNSDKACIVCDFYSAYDGYNASYSCCRARMEWLKAEYIEQMIDLPDNIAINARIQVSLDGKIWHNAHYGGRYSDAVKAWTDGKTSWTSDTGEYYSWPYARLPMEDDNG